MQQRKIFPREKLKGIGANLDGWRDQEKSLLSGLGEKYGWGRMAQESAGNRLDRSRRRGKYLQSPWGKKEFDAFEKRKEGQCGWNLVTERKRGVCRS